MTTIDPSSPFSPGYQNPWVAPNPDKGGKPASPLDPTPVGVTPPTNTGGPFGLGNLITLIGTLGRPDFWIRAGIFSAGAGLVIVGIVILVSSSKVVGEALTMAGKSAKLTPAGAAASVASEALS